MVSLYNLIDLMLSMYTGCVLVWVLMSWLIAFDVINPRQTLVRMVGQFLSGIIEPVLTPIRRVIPMIGGIDLSSIILFFGIYLIRSLFAEYWFVLFA